jgi:predicted dienelactone hydrolase
MKRALLILLFTALNAFGGTFTKVATLIPVTNSVNLDANVYIPDGAVAPMPVVVVMHGFGASKNEDVVDAIAGDLASAGYVVLAPSARVRQFRWPRHARRTKRNQRSPNHDPRHAIRYDWRCFHPGHIEQSLWRDRPIVRRWTDV